MVVVSFRTDVLNLPSPSTESVSDMGLLSPKSFSASENLLCFAMFQKVASRRNDFKFDIGYLTRCFPRASNGSPRSRGKRHGGNKADRERT